MISPKLDLYRIFLTAVRAGSFTEAGHQLFMTQSAVSQAMAQLEQALDTALFFRSGRGVALTAEGEALKAHLVVAFDAIQMGEQAVMALKHLEAGVLHIAASDTLCRHLLLPAFRRFHAQHPEIHLQVTNRPSPACLQMVHHREADLAFVNRSDYPPPPGIQLDNVLEYEDIFVCNDAHRILGSSAPALESILKEPLILLEAGSSTRENLEQWAASQGLPLTPGIEVGSVDVILDLVSIGLGIGWIPGYALPTGPEARVFRLATRTRPPGRTVAMASGPAPGISRTAKAFMDMILSDRE